MPSLRAFFAQFKVEDCGRCGGTGTNGRGDWCWVCLGSGRVRRRDQR